MWCGEKVASFKFCMTQLVRLKCVRQIMLCQTMLFKHVCNDHNRASLASTDFLLHFINVIERWIKCTNHECHPHISASRPWKRANVEGIGKDIVKLLFEEGLTRSHCSCPRTPRWNTWRLQHKSSGRGESDGANAPTSYCTVHRHLCKLPRLL